MADEELKNLDEYEVFLTERLTPWSPLKRVALAAAIAERWLPAYDSFSAEEEWGDPAALRHSLDAIWGHVQGRALTDAARQLKQIEDITPHVDDFDSPDAINCCAVLMDALHACGSAENTIPYVTRAALGVFEGIVQEWPIDPVSQRRVWQKSAIRKELQAQLKLIEEINAVASFDADSVQVLRRRLAEYKVKGRAKPKPEAPPGLTNQTAFEQYRRMVEADLKRQVKGEGGPALGFLFGLRYFGFWLGRYSRRRQTIDGSYGRLADELGEQALVARNRAVDAADKGVPEWDKEVRDALDRCLTMNCQHKITDAGGVAAPHAYGSSMRRLWLEGKRLGLSDDDAWNHICTWANHRPAAWEAEDRRKKKGLAHSAPALRERLAHELSWRSTDDPLHPWSTEVHGASWRVRVNDFPDELMYSLIIGDENAGDFHDWPASWRRPGAAGGASRSAS
jgi:uncharacterized protein YjaG (DUF416 family)